MEYKIQKLKTNDFPHLLSEISDPPEELWYRGILPDPSLKLLTVVGSRAYSSYGEQVIDHLTQGLRGYPIGIVSGLAIGVDGLAHRAALKYGLYTLAVPGSGLDDNVLYPRRHMRLVSEILRSNGGLISEFPPTTSAAPWTFPQRNRIMAGLAHATLVIEAREKSGTLITARLAVDYNRELLVVPGNIFSQNTAGSHQFLKLGATPVTTGFDILEALNIEKKESQRIDKKDLYLSPNEKLILDLLTEPTDRDTLIRKVNIPINIINVTLMEMEFKGYLKNDKNILYPTSTS